MCHEQLEPSPFKIRSDEEDMKMKKSISRRRNWILILAPLPFMLGITAVVSWIGGSDLGSYTKRIAAGYDAPLQQVVMPGETDLTLSRTGAYGIYHEYRSVVDGVDYRSEKGVPEFNCSLTHQGTLQDAALALDYVPTNQYHFQRDKRVGVLIYSTTIKDPGRYVFACAYPDGASSPETVLAIGPNYVWEFFKAVKDTLAPLLVSPFLLCGSTLLSMIFVALGLVMHRKLVGRSETGEEQAFANIPK